MISLGHVVAGPAFAAKMNVRGWRSRCGLSLSWQYGGLMWRTFRTWRLYSCSRLTCESNNESGSTESRHCFRISSGKPDLVLPLDGVEAGLEIAVVHHRLVRFSCSRSVIQPSPMRSVINWARRVGLQQPAALVMPLVLLLNRSGNIS